MSNGNPYQDSHETIGADQRLALAQVSAQDPFYNSAEQSQFVPKEPVNIRNYFLTHRDIYPAGSSVTRIPFGSQVTFKVGNEGLPNLYACELHIELPIVYGSDAAYHPSHASSTATKQGGGTATFLDWQPYVAEKFISKSGEPARWMYGTETLRSFTAAGLHCKRALCFDSEATTKAAAYKNSVGAVSDSTADIRYYRLILPLPQGTDDVNFHQMLPVQAFGQEFVFKFQIPLLTELVRTDCTASSVAVPASVTGTAAYPAVFMRAHYHVPEKAERGLYANALLKPKGLTFQTMHIARETQVTGITSSAQTVKTAIRNSTNPCVFMVAGLRFTDDGSPIATVVSVADSNVPARVIGTTVVAPNWTNWLRWDAVAVMDNNSRIMPKRGYDDWQNSVANGISCFFPCDITTNLCVVPFSAFPRVENSGLGHITLTALSSPSLWLDIPANATADSTCTRTLDIFYYERNMCHMKDGNIYRWFAVQD